MDHQDNTTPAIPADVRARIIEAATRLFESSGGERFPAVADVRRLAKTDMNATSAVIREWKRQQSAKPQPVAVEVPEPVQQAGIAQLAVVWSAAQELANASLRNAQAAWATEREEMESMREELAQLYEAQARELEELQQALSAAREGQAAAELLAQSLQERLAEMKSRAEQAEARNEEIERRAADLKDELERQREDAQVLKTELAESRVHRRQEIDRLEKAAAEQIELARSDLATYTGKAEAAQQGMAAQIEQLQAALQQCQGDLVAASKEAAAARENAARLAGQLETHQEHNAALLERLKPTEKTTEKAGKKP